MNNSDYAAGCAWIGGRYVPIDEAAVPITDTGFTRSDVTYDVVGVWGGKFFRLDDHLQRFEQSWQRLRMRAPLARAEIAATLHECVARAGLREAYVEMILTRGIPRGGDRDPRNFENRFYAFAIPYVWIVQPTQQLQGIKLIVANDTRRTPTTSLDPTVKNFQWGDLMQGLFEAYDRDAYTAVLLDADDNVTEGPGFNVFALCEGVLLTPASGVLQGITRATVIELTARRGVEVRVGGFTAEQLRAADEVFLTSTAGGVMPVGQVDDTKIGAGTPGKFTLSLREDYWLAHEDGQWTTPINYPRALESAG